MSTSQSFGDRWLSVSSKILLTGGLMLVVAGLVSGEVFALLLSHTLNARLQGAWQQVLALAGTADVDTIIPLFDHIHDLATDRARAMSLHSHFGPYGLLAAGLALAKAEFGIDGRFDNVAAILILAGGLVQSLGFLSLDYGVTPSLGVSHVGIAMLILGTVLYMSGLLRSAPHAVLLPGVNLAAGKLLRAGAALVFAGQLFGLYLAWRHVFFEEPILRSALHDLVSTVQAGDQPTASLLYTNFKSTQVRMAITAASHSHAVTFGFIMIVAALAARYLNLSVLWRNSAFILIGAGGLLLPVFVYLAPRYGYVFALCADSAGGFVILGLMIVLTGLLSPRRESQ